MKFYESEIFEWGSRPLYNYVLSLPLPDKEKLVLAVIASFNDISQSFEHTDAPERATVENVIKQLRAPGDEIRRVIDDLVADGFVIKAVSASGYNVLSTHPSLPSFYKFFASLEKWKTASKSNYPDVLSCLNAVSSSIRLALRMDKRSVEAIEEALPGIFHLCVLDWRRGDKEIRYIIGEPVKWEELDDYEEGFIVDNSEYLKSLEDSQSEFLAIPESLMELFRSGKVSGDKFRVIAMLLSKDQALGVNDEAFRQTYDELTLKRYLKELADDGFCRQTSKPNRSGAPIGYSINTPEKWSLREFSNAPNSFNYE